MTLLALRRRHTVLPGFRLTMGYTIFYLCLIVLVPLLTLPARTASLGWDGAGTVEAAGRDCTLFRPGMRSTTPAT